MVTIGASHRTTSVAALGEMSRAALDLKRRLREGGPRGLDLPVEELAVLTTCGRVELYAVPQPSESRAVSEIVAREVFGVRATPDSGETGQRDVPYILEGGHVVRHLCRVASGLDSVVPGEHEISGQVARAFGDVVRRAGRGTVLSSVAAIAREASRRVHAETSVGRRAASVGSVAVEIARERLGDLGARAAVVVGAGAAGLAIGRALRGGGVGGLTLVGRTGRTHEAAQAVGAAAASPDGLVELIREADVVIVAAGAEGFLVDVKMLAEATRGRERRPLLVIDLAVPADVDPAVAHLPGVELLGLDDVRERVNRHVALRREELVPAEAVIDEVVGELDRATHDVDAVIGKLRRSVEDVRAREVARWLGGRNGAGAPSRDELDQFTRSLVNKLLHDPMIRLRTSGANAEDGSALLDAAAELFGLTDRTGPDTSRRKE